MRNGSEGRAGLQSGVIAQVSRHQHRYLSPTDPRQQFICLKASTAQETSPLSIPAVWGRPLGSFDSSPPHRRCLVRVACRRGRQKTATTSLLLGLSSPSQAESPTCPSLLPWAAADADEIDAVEPARLLPPVPPPAAPLLSRVAAAAGAAAAGRAGAAAGAGEALTAWLPMPNIRSTWAKECGRAEGAGKPTKRARRSPLVPDTQRVPETGTLFRRGWGGGGKKSEPKIRGNSKSMLGSKTNLEILVREAEMIGKKLVGETFSPT